MNSSGKFIDKSAVNVNRTTNATGLLSAIGAIGAAYDGVANGRPVGVWLPMVAMGMAGAIAQWLQGEPTPTTRLIARVLQLDGTKTNAELVRHAIDRIINSGVIPGLGTPGAGDGLARSGAPERRGNALNAELLDRMAVSSDYSDRGTDNLRSPSIAPPENIRAAAWAAADVARGNVQIEGANMTRRQFADFSNGGDFDEVTQG